MSELKITEKKSTPCLQSKKKAKPKIDWLGIVHKGCRVCIFRTIEVVMIVFMISILTLLIGGIALPALSYNMASGIGITQGTDIYTAMASWLIPMLFFTLLITGATFCVLRKFIRWVHNYFSSAIRLGNERDDMKRGVVA